MEPPCESVQDGVSAKYRPKSPRPSAAELVDENSRLCRLLEEREKEILQASQIGQVLVEQTNALRQEKDEMEITLRGEIAYKESELFQLRSENNALLFKCSGLRSERNAIQLERDELEDRYTALQREYTFLRSDSAKNEQAMRERIDSLLDEIDGYRHELLRFRFATPSLSKANSFISPRTRSFRRVPACSDRVTPPPPAPCTSSAFELPSPDATIPSFPDLTAEHTPPNYCGGGEDKEKDREHNVDFIVPGARRVSVVSISEEFGSEEGQSRRDSGGGGDFRPLAPPPARASGLSLHEELKESILELLEKGGAQPKSKPHKHIVRVKKRSGSIRGSLPTEDTLTDHSTEGEHKHEPVSDLIEMVESVFDSRAQSTQNSDEINSPSLASILDDATVQTILAQAGVTKKLTKQKRRKLSIKSRPPLPQQENSGNDLGDPKPEPDLPPFSHTDGERDCCDPPQWASANSIPSVQDPKEGQHAISDTPLIVIEHEREGEVSDSKDPESFVKESGFSSAEGHCDPALLHAHYTHVELSTSTDGTVEAHSGQVAEHSFRLQREEKVEAVGSERHHHAKIPHPHHHHVKGLQPQHAAPVERRSHKAAALSCSGVHCEFIGEKKETDELDPTTHEPTPDHREATVAVNECQTEEHAFLLSDDESVVQSISTLGESDSALGDNKVLAIAESVEVAIPAAEWTDEETSRQDEEEGSDLEEQEVWDETEATCEESDDEHDDLLFCIASLLRVIRNLQEKMHSDSDKEKAQEKIKDLESQLTGLKAELESKTKELNFFYDELSVAKHMCSEMQHRYEEDLRNFMSGTAGAPHQQQQQQQQSVQPPSVQIQSIALPLFLSVQPTSHQDGISPDLKSLSQELIETAVEIPDSQHPALAMSPALGTPPPTPSGPFIPATPADPSGLYSHVLSDRVRQSRFLFEQLRDSATKFVHPTESRKGPYEAIRVVSSNINDTLLQVREIFSQEYKDWEERNVSAAHEVEGGSSAAPLSVMDIFAKFLQSTKQQSDSPPPTFRLHRKSLYGSCAPARGAGSLDILSARSLVSPTSGGSSSLPSSRRPSSKSFKPFKPSRDPTVTYRVRGEDFDALTQLLFDMLIDNAHLRKALNDLSQQYLFRQVVADLEEPTHFGLRRTDELPPSQRTSISASSDSDLSRSSSSTSILSDSHLENVMSMGVSTFDEQQTAAEPVSIDPFSTPQRPPFSISPIKVDETFSMENRPETMDVFIAHGFTRDMLAPPPTPASKGDSEHMLPLTPSNRFFNFFFPTPR